MQESPDLLLAAREQYAEILANTGVLEKLTHIIHLTLREAGFTGMGIIGTAEVIAEMVAIHHDFVSLRTQNQPASDTEAVDSFTEIEPPVLAGHQQLAVSLMLPNSNPDDITGFIAARFSQAPLLLEQAKRDAVRSKEGGFFLPQGLVHPMTEQ